MFLGGSFAQKQFPQHRDGRGRGRGPEGFLQVSREVATKPRRAGLSSTRTTTKPKMAWSVATTMMGVTIRCQEHHKKLAGPMGPGVAQPS